MTLSVVQSNSTLKKQIDVQVITDSFKSVSHDIEQIGRLVSKEKSLVDELFSIILKHMKPVTNSIQVSISLFPIKMCEIVDAQMDLTGHLTLFFIDGRQELIDLREMKNRDLMIKVMDDIIPKLNDLINHIQEGEVEVASQIVETNLPLQTVTQEISPVVNVETPIVSIEPVLPELQQEQASEINLSAEFAEKNAKIEEITKEALDYLEMLGDEVFEQKPISKYFDDWMVNLRQIVVSFESNEAIGPDEIFTKDYNQIFSNIEDELTKILLNESEIEVSARTLVENRYLLNKIDEGYAAQTKDFVDREKSAIEYLMRNMKIIEKELEEVQQIKISYLHPLKKMAKDQKVAELTQKLNAVKKRLAVAVGTSSVDNEKTGDIDAIFAAQSRELEEKRKIALDLLTKNVEDLQNEISGLKKNTTNNPIKKISIQQKLFELNDKLVDAKQRLELAEKSSSYEMEKLRAEYEKKKQATLGKVKTLETDIAKKAVDTSLGVRKEAVRALSEAVKSLVQRKNSTQ